ncbi:MAG: TetR-family transcriptional regulator [Alphaproteobacteria bacterium]|jgi:AcrR family transcriptional regulator|nr:TetR-family transcriptional regulator [Alphaproteobacteria bacterium]
MPSPSNQRSRPQRTPNKVRRAETREAVLVAARSLFVRQGYLRTSVDEIARQAGISKGGIYFHFPDKADIVHELLMNTIELYRDLLGELRDRSKPPLERLRSYMNWTSNLGAREPEAMLLPILISLEFLHTGHEIESLTRSHYDAIHRGLQLTIFDGRKAGVFNKRSGAREQAANIILMGDGALLEWLRRSDVLSGTKLARALQQFILDALLVPDAQQAAVALPAVQTAAPPPAKRR